MNKFNLTLKTHGIAHIKHETYWNENTHMENSNWKCMHRTIKQCYTLLFNKFNFIGNTYTCTHTNIQTYFPYQLSECINEWMNELNKLNSLNRIDRISFSPSLSLFLSLSFSLSYFILSNNNKTNCRCKFESKPWQYTRKSIRFK